MHIRRVVPVTLLLLAGSLSSTALNRATAAVATPAQTAKVTDRRVTAGFINASLDGIHYDVARLGYRIDFIAETRPQRALTNEAARDISVYVRPGQTVQLTSKILAYEVGHVVDFWTGTKTSRRAWLRARHARPGTHWWAPNAAPEWHYGSGDFADVFSLWATGNNVDYVSDVAAQPTPAQLARLARYFTRTALATPDDQAP